MRRLLDFELYSADVDGHWSSGPQRAHDWAVVRLRQHAYQLNHVKDPKIDESTVSVKVEPLETPWSNATVKVKIRGVVENA